MKTFDCQGRPSITDWFIMSISVTIFLNLLVSNIFISCWSNLSEFTLYIDFSLNELLVTLVRHKTAECILKITSTDCECNHIATETVSLLSRMKKFDQDLFYTLSVYL